MCKAGLFVLAAQYVADSAVFQVVRDGISGNNSGQFRSEEELLAEETAFID